MENKLTFPSVFEEHLKYVMSQSSQQEIDQVKSALHHFYDIGATEIVLNSYGEKGVEKGTDIDILPIRLYKNLSSEVCESLSYYSSCAANKLNPYYEVGVGGGCRCTITFYPFSVKIQTYEREIIEHLGDTIIVE